MVRKDVTYSPSFFKRLKEVEKKHFWFATRRKHILDKIAKFVSPPARLLEIGCGTGNVSSFLAKKGYNVTGCEYYREAMDNSWGGFKVVQADAEALPFKDGSFDIVGLFDVIEHFKDDLVPLKEANRVLTKGGIMVITVPAREELWSWVDEISFHKRRYTKDLFKQLFMELKLKPLDVEYMFLSLYAPMRYIRKKDTQKDLFEINAFANMLLKVLFHTERIVSKVIPLPIGTSLIAVARKE